VKTSRTNIYRTNKWFKVLQTSKRSQTAVMTLGPGQPSGEDAESHKSSEQIVLLVSGELNASIGGRRSRMTSGDVVIIPPGTRHKFVNNGSEPAVTFSVYCPPEYPTSEEG
jgi:mannose-6-phosphate isomerase-like protein (cupin superfamily)